MNIAVVAPQRFAFQDLVCAELGLRFKDRPEARLRPEPAGGEDASLVFRDGASFRTVEVQIKDEAAALTLERVAEMLAHFPPRRATDTFLERLDGDPNRAALFVMSGRCDDVTANLLAGDRWDGAQRAAVPAAVRHLARRFLEALLRVADGLDIAKPLGRRRQDHLRGVATGMGEDEAAIVLSRVFIAERETFATVEVRFQERLRVGHRVPSDWLRDGLARLTGVVAEAKVAGDDALPGLRRTVEGLSPRAIGPAGYVDRGVEADLHRRLSSDRALLLAGPPRAGKSWTARRVVGLLQPQGYEVSQGTRVDEAERFLLDGSRVERAFVLDDPLGARWAHVTASADLAALRSLVERLPSDRRLVVAQGQDPLLATMRQADLSRCRLGALDWLPLREVDTGTAVAIWTAAALRHGLSDDKIRLVEGFIREGDDLLEAGALTFLAATFPDLPDGADRELVIAQARRDAIDVMAELSERHVAMRSLLASLAVSTRPLAPVSRTDLAFTLSGGNDRPTRDSEHGGRIMSFGAVEQARRATPAYREDFRLDEASEISLEALLRRRFVAVPDEDRINFAHPFYRAGAQAVLNAPTPRVLDETLEQAGRALFGLSSVTSKAAARSLSWLQEAVAPLPGGRARVIELAEEGLRSLFPGTRDLCFEHLLSQLPSLPRSRSSAVRHWARWVTLDLEDVIERDGVAWIETGEVEAMQVLARRLETVDIAEVRPYLDAIEAGRAIDLDFGLSRRIVIAVEADRGAMTPQVLARLLAVDEAVIRARAVGAWLIEPRQDDEESLDRIGLDRHPGVAVSALMAVASGWDDFDVQRRDRLLRLLAGLAGSPGAAVGMFLRGVLFDRQERFGAAPPWSVFGAVMPVAIRLLPDAMSLNDGRLLNATEKAVGSLGHGLVPLFEAWAERIERKVRASLPGGSELGLIGPLLDATATHPGARGNIVTRLLQVEGTGTQIAFIAQAVDRWANLTERERRSVLALLAGDRPDIAWLRAAALTREIVPTDVQGALLGREDVLAQEPGRLLATLGPVLTGAGLRVHTGSPQPLWWLDTHHARSAAWQGLVSHVGARPAHPDFDVAFADAFTRSDATFVAEVVRDANDKHLPRLFKAMLQHKICANGNWMTEAWDILLARGIAAGHGASWFESMADAAPRFMDRLGDVELWLYDAGHRATLLKHFKADELALLYCYVLQELRSSSARLGLREEEYDDGDEGESLDPGLAHRAIQAILDQVPPQLHETYQRIRDTLDDLGWKDPSLDGQLKDRRNAILEAMYPSPPEGEPLPGWIGPR